MRSLTLLFALCVAVSLGGCSICCTVHECCPGRYSEANRPGIDIPDAVLADVLKVLPGFVATEIEIQSKDGQLIYEMEGTSQGGKYEVEVDGDGNVLRIDQEIDEADEGPEADHDGDDDGDDYDEEHKGDGDRD